MAGWWWIPGNEVVDLPLQRAELVCRYDSGQHYVALQIKRAQLFAAKHRRRLSESWSGTQAACEPILEGPKLKRNGEGEDPPRAPPDQTAPKWVRFTSATFSKRWV